MMKRFAATFIALALLLALAVPALADAHWYEGPNPWYVNREELKVFETWDKESEIIKKLKGGDAVTVESVTDNEKWMGILVEDTEHGGQKLGWVPAKYLSETMPQSFCPHDWGKWHVESEPTCTEPGYRYRLCKICGIRDEDSMDRIAHSYGKWKVTREATCVKKGERTRTCSACGHEQKEEYLDEHTFGEWKVTKQPTCTEKGERKHTCKVCGLEEKQQMDKLPHDYEWHVTLEATDHSSGIRSKVCKVCGHNGGEESFDPEGTLRRKDKGEDVRAMQQLLVEQGYLNVGGADGIFGGGTEKALMQYQKDRGLNPDGIAWPQTLADLQHDYGPWETVKQMTRTEAGERVRVCRGCGFEQHETIECGTVFEKGRRGEDVRALQQIIKEVGYDAGSFDGIYGKKLDAALAGFAADRGMIVEEGKVRPADVDAVVNAWLDGMDDATWMGEGGVDSPVNLALTVTSSGESEDTEGVATYSWSLTNLGGEKAMFNALLLTFGEEPDFRHNDLVMALDGFELKPGAGNSISGTFSASGDWGEGSLNIAAMAVSEATGMKWLSNTVTYENEAAPAARTIEPAAEPLDVNDLPDGIYPVSFDRGDIFTGASGVFMNAVHIYTEDVFDILDINLLKAGDTIVLGGASIPVESIERGDRVIINGGLEEGGVELSGREDGNGFYFCGFDDMSSYTERGVTTLVVDPAATYTDSSDIESEPVTVGADGIAEAMLTSGNPFFDEYNTTVRIENGRVAEINRTYVP